MDGDKKRKILLYFCILAFGVVGVYLTFFRSDISKFDSKTKAYRIYANESTSSDSTTYSPIYYFIVDGKEYECRTTAGSSSYPSDDKNTVYYDSKDPSNCKTEYETSTGRVAGIICLVATIVIVYFFIIKKPSDFDQSSEREYSSSENIIQNPEDAEKVLNVINKVQLIYKRVILGIIIIILLVLTLIDTAIFKQTIKAKDYIETTATIVNESEKQEDSIFDDYVYTFKDKNGNNQEITVGVSKGESPNQEIKIKYDENNPQEFYTEGSTLDKSGIIWYIVKVVALILLIVLFFNKKLLSKIGISLGNPTK